MPPMKAKIYTAQKVHNGHHFLPAGSAIEVDASGEILSILESAPQDALHFDGILCPGFVNAHCHLELSHLKGLVAEKTGLISFLLRVTSQRFNFSEEEKEIALRAAVAELHSEGIVAVGDIANTTDTVAIRETSGLHFHTFIELIGFDASKAEIAFQNGQELLEKFEEKSTSEIAGNFQAEHPSKIKNQSLAAHTPYSVSEKLFRKIDTQPAETIISVHNQESAEEDKFYRDFSGDIHRLLDAFKIDKSLFAASGKSSLETWQHWFSENKKLLLVHNTFSEKTAVKSLLQKFPTAYFALCPAANLYIENRLPNVEMLCAETDNICLGTDSLASNNRLSILAEMQILNMHSPAIGWETLLRWATLRGAEALGMQSEIGSLEIGKRPGLLHLGTTIEGAPNKVTRIATNPIPGRGADRIS